MISRPEVRWLEKPLRALLKPVQRLMIATGSGPLRPLWAAGYGLLIRGVTAWIRAISPGAAVFVRGSFARGTPAYGLSDLDLILVAADDDRAKALDARVVALYARLPLAKDIVEVSVYSRSRLRRTLTEPFLAWPAGPQEHLLRFAGPATGGSGLTGPLRCWRLLAGEDPLGGRQAEDRPEYRSLRAWMDLQFYWKHFFRNCAHPGVYTRRYLTKTTLRLGEMLVWLESGEIRRSEGELRQFGASHPEVQELLERLLRDQGSFSEVLDLLDRVSRRVAKRIAGEAERAEGVVRVRLIGEVAGATIPLLDWRGRVLPEPPEVLAVSKGDMAVEPIVAAAVRTESGVRGRSARAALLSEELLLLPDPRRAVARVSPALFRAIQCRFTDPVSFALLGGKREAWFPELPGRAIGHAAARGRAEFRYWLRNGHEQAGAPGERLAGLFSAARAGLLWESLEEGSRELLLTPRAVASRLAVRAEAALEAYEDWASGAGGGEPRREVVVEFEKVVEGLAAYRVRPARSYTRIVPSR